MEPSASNVCSDVRAENDAWTSQDLAGASSYDFDLETQIQYKWTKERFVVEVRQYQCLWDTSCRAYKDGMKKQQAWREISAKLGASGM